MTEVDLAAPLRRRLNRWAIEGFFEGAAALARFSPTTWPSMYGVEVERDVAYRDSGLVEHRLDIYRPSAVARPWPVVIYVHGGGFSLLSKETHVVLALEFARHGFLVFNLNYRLAPTHRYPAALEDVAAAYGWVARHAAACGGDLSRLVLAGESAGANLATALTVAASYERPEPSAREVWDLDLRPRVVWAACGFHQVSHPSRLATSVSAWSLERLVDVSTLYLPAGTDPESPRGDLADPLLILESSARPARPLPAFFVSVGTADPLLDDSQRLARALTQLGVRHEAHVYDGELHAFQAFLWRAQARQCWRSTFEFLARALVEV